MRWRRLSALLLLALLPMLRPAPVAAQAERTFFYTEVFRDIDGYELHEDGSISRIPGDTVDTGAPGVQLATQTLTYSAQQRMLFSATKEGIVVFRVAADGQLSDRSAPHGGAWFGPLTVVEVGEETFLYGVEVGFADLPGDANSEQRHAPRDHIRGFRVRTSGRLEPVMQPLRVDRWVDRLRTVGRLLFTSDKLSDTLRAYRVQPDGGLRSAQGSPFRTGARHNTGALEVDARRGQLFTFGTRAAGRGLVYGYRISQTGAVLRPLPNSPVRVFMGSGTPLPTPGPVVLMLRDWERDNGEPVRRGEDGTLSRDPLTPGVSGPIDQLGFPALDPSGRSLVGAYRLDDPHPPRQVFSYAVDGETGSVTSAGRVRFVRETPHIYYSGLAFAPQ